MFMYGRNQHDIARQLFFNEKYINLKKRQRTSRVMINVELSFLCKTMGVLAEEMGKINGRENKAIQL